MLLLAGAMGAPSAIRAQQKAMPVIGYLDGTSPGPGAPLVAAFRQGLGETGYVEGKNLAIEYRWAEFRYDRLPALAADLVGTSEDRRRDAETERVCRLQVYDQLENRWLLHRQISRLLASEDPPDVNTHLAPRAGKARSVADQAAGRGELTILIDRRDDMACRQRHELLAATVEKWVGSDNERAGVEFDERGESGVDLAFGAGL